MLKGCRRAVPALFCQPQRTRETDKASRLGVALDAALSASPRRTRAAHRKVRRACRAIRGELDLIQIKRCQHPLGYAAPGLDTDMMALWSMDNAGILKSVQFYLRNSHFEGG